VTQPSGIGRNLGPYVQVATICQSALHENTGPLSLIRITDRVGVPGTTPDMPPTQLQNLTLVIVLKAGEMRGRYNVKITTTFNEQKLGEIEIPVLFEADDRGVGIILPTSLGVREEGVYWFEVDLVGIGFLTRIPLRVMYQRMPQLGGPMPPPSTI
jgi:hypothetical protein